MEGEFYLKSSEEETQDNKKRWSDFIYFIAICVAICNFQLIALVSNAIANIAAINIVAINIAAVIWKTIRFERVAHQVTQIG